MNFYNQQLRKLLPVQCVRLRLQAGHYSREIETIVVSDAVGFSAIEQAISNAYESRLGWHFVSDPECPEAGAEMMAHVELFSPSGESVMVDDSDLRGKEWLADLVVGAEIIDQYCTPRQLARAQP